MSRPKKVPQIDRRNFLRRKALRGFLKKSAKPPPVLPPF